MLPKIGDKVFIRCITFHYVGEIVDKDPIHIQLKNASWVADSGRFYNALADGTLSEVEPYPHGVTIMTQSIVDISPWVHDLPTKQQ